MNTEILTTPSPELKQHAEDLRKDAGLVAQDVKNQASAGYAEIKTEANARFNDAKGTAMDLYDSVKDFAAKHPFSVFGVGLAFGLMLAMRQGK